MKVLKTICMGIGAVALLFSCSAAPKAPQLTTSGLDAAKFDTTIQNMPV